MWQSKGKQFAIPIVFAVTGETRAGGRGEGAGVGPRQVVSLPHSDHIIKRAPRRVTRPEQITLGIPRPATARLSRVRDVARRRCELDHCGALQPLASCVALRTYLVFKV
jgi:hypothetical protein